MKSVGGDGVFSCAQRSAQEWRTRKQPKKDGGIVAIFALRDQKEALILCLAPPQLCGCCNGALVDGIGGR